jgi:hypothetical protein
MFCFEVVLLGIPLLGFCSLRIYHLLSPHINAVTARQNMTSEQIRIEKSILKTIVMQALIPVLLLLPTVFVLVVALLGGWEAKAIDLTLFSYGNSHEYQYTAMDLCFLIQVMIPTLDSFITLRVLKSYRKAAKKVLAKFKIC